MKLLLVGYGKMGQALLSGWLTKQSDTQYAIIDPYAENSPENTELYKTADDLPTDFQPDCVIFAIKPQVMIDTLPLYQQFVSQNCFYLSIAAGKTLDFLATHLGTDAKIIRAMPNTPAAISEGITVITGNARVEEKDKQMSINLLKTIGKTAWIDNENIMNAVTAVSGSGPAYIFLLIETMAKAGIKAGLPEKLAEDIARQTVIGSASLAAHEQNTSAVTLRENVTSPGGTTAAALDILMNDNTGLQQLMDKAIAAATARGKELSLEK